MRRISIIASPVPRKSWRTEISSSRSTLAAPTPPLSLATMCCSGRSNPPTMAQPCAHLSMPSSFRAAALLSRSRSTMSTGAAEPMTSRSGRWRYGWLKLAPLML
uniref:GH3-9 n=1 Tax=Arundo donax TaxID=35708 RepID=A0A0A8XQD4_ARUDO